MNLSSDEAATAIRTGQWRGPASVSGRLDLTKFPGTSLPEGLHCYELDASGSQLASLPADLKIDGVSCSMTALIFRLFRKAYRLAPSACATVSPCVLCQRI